ncbi:hypothetical protein JW962_01410 [Candidatus Dojkabacteria bacterium]|nr:hypothetical protein [Candidatus Dojkabacteria bacterium]
MASVFSPYGREFHFVPFQRARTLPGLDYGTWDGLTRSSSEASERQSPHEHENK